MANSLITNQMIAKEAVALWKNFNAFLQNVDRQYDDSFATTGAKEGQNIRIRLPVDYIVRNGPTATAQNTVETYANLPVATQQGVDMSFSTVDRTMSIDRFSERYIRPAINVTAGAVAAGLMAGSEAGSNGFVANYDTSGNILNPVAGTWLSAKALLSNRAVPDTRFKIVMSPSTEAHTVSSLAGLFNSQPILAKQYETGNMMHALGFDWMADQTAIIHTTGAYATSPTWNAAVNGFPSGSTVNGANQTGTTITISALSGPMNVGDQVFFAGCYGVNPITKASTGSLRHFTVQTAASAGATSLSLYPALLGVDGSGNPQQYQTVTASPANSAIMYVVSAPSSQYRKSLAFVPNAMTLAMVDLDMPPNVEAARATLDDVTIRVVTQYQGTSDQLLTRLDILWGFAYLRPEWCVVVADAL